MADDIKTTGKICLRPAEIETHGLFVPTESAVNANDGVIKYGETILSHTLTARNHETLADVTDLIVLSTLDVDTIRFKVKYPITSKAGRYDLVFLLTMSDGDVIKILFETIHVYDN